MKRWMVLYTLGIGFVLLLFASPTLADCQICRCAQHVCVHAGPNQNGSTSCVDGCNCPITFDCLGFADFEDGVTTMTDEALSMTPGPEIESSPFPKCKAKLEADWNTPETIAAADQCSVDTGI